MTNLYKFNFFFLQWFFVRLELEVETDGSLAGINLIGPIIPLTGWWGGYIPQCFKRWKLR